RSRALLRRRAGGNDREKARAALRGRVQLRQHALGRRAPAASAGTRRSKMSRVIAAALLLTIRSVAQAQDSKDAVLVITASARDYLFGAGVLLARMVDEGRPLYVLQFGNDEKDSVGLGPAETREANNIEAERAAKILGVREVLNLGHKSGELGYIS